MRQVGVTRQYKELLGRARRFRSSTIEASTSTATSSARPLTASSTWSARGGEDPPDPAARVTDLLKDVFGSAVPR